MGITCVSMLCSCVYERKIEKEKERERRGDKKRGGGREREVHVHVVERKKEGERERERERERESEMMCLLSCIMCTPLSHTYILTHTHTSLGAMALSKPRLEIVEQPKSVSKPFEFG